LQGKLAGLVEVAAVGKAGERVIHRRTFQLRLLLDQAVVGRSQTAGALAPCLGQRPSAGLWTAVPMVKSMRKPSAPNLKPPMWAIMQAAVPPPPLMLIPASMQGSGHAVHGVRVGRLQSW
jgi:hypothetical protein